MNKSTKRIHFFISERDHVRLKHRVDKSGLTLSAYMRHMINNRIPQDRPPPEYFELLKELRAIGRNINQIALVANATGIIDAGKYDEWYRELISFILKVIEVAEMPKETSLLQPVEQNPLIGNCGLR